MTNNFEESNDLIKQLEDELEKTKDAFHGIVNAHGKRYPDIETRIKALCNNMLEIREKINEIKNT